MELLRLGFEFLEPSLRVDIDRILGVFAYIEFGLEGLRRLCIRQLLYPQPRLLSTYADDAFLEPLEAHLLANCVQCSIRCV